MKPTQEDKARFQRWVNGSTDKADRRLRLFLRLGWIVADANPFPWLGNAWRVTNEGRKILGR